jgi:hypothetical protein
LITRIIFNIKVLVCDFRDMINFLLSGVVSTTPNP